MAAIVDIQGVVWFANFNRTRLGGKLEWNCLFKNFHDLPSAHCKFSSFGSSLVIFGSISKIHLYANTKPQGQAIRLTLLHFHRLIQIF